MGESEFYFGIVDIITGVATGGLYHLQTEVCISLGNLNGDLGWDVLDIVIMVNTILS